MSFRLSFSISKSYFYIGWQDGFRYGLRPFNEEDRIWSFYPFVEPEIDDIFLISQPISVNVNDLSDYWMICTIDVENREGRASDQINGPQSGSHTLDECCFSRAQITFQSNDLSALEGG